MTRRPATTSIPLAGAALITMLAAACGATPTTKGQSSSGTTAATSTPAAPGGVLGVASTSLGSVLVDGQGRTLYLLTADSPNHSSCSAQCLQYWPPAPAPSGASLPTVAGVSATLATTKATSGAAMLTAGGWPLYTFVKDQKPGDVTGQGVATFGGTWYAVSPAGQPVKAAPAPPSSSSSSSGGGGGYGNY